MKKKFTLLFVVSLLTANAKASEPVDSYLSALVQGAGDNLWWVYPKEIDGQIITPPKGGYIFRLLMDADGDGTNEVFLTDDGQVMRDGASWSLYRQTSSGIYLKLDENAWLPSVLWVKTDGGIKKYSYVGPQDKDSGIEEINAFWIDATGSYQTSTQQLTEAQSKAINGGDQTLMDANGLPDRNKIANYLNIGDPVTLTIQKVLVGKIYQDANATWRDVNNSCSLSQQYLDPADAAEIASLANWTPPSNP